MEQVDPPHCRVCFLTLGVRNGRRELTHTVRGLMTQEARAGVCTWVSDSEAHIFNLGLPTYIPFSCGGRGIDHVAATGLGKMSVSPGVHCKVALWSWGYGAGDQETCTRVFLPPAPTPALLCDLEKVTFLLWAPASSLPNGDDHP